MNFTFDSGHTLSGTVTLGSHHDMIKVPPGCYRVKFVSFITRVDANGKVPDLLIAARGANRTVGVDSVSAIMLPCVLLEFRRRWRGAFLPWPACV
jgi:hypothetical protein